MSTINNLNLYLYYWRCFSN